MSSKLFKNFIRKAIFSKQGPPGPAPREGLQWKPQTRRWIRPDPYAGMKSWEREEARNRNRYDVKVQDARDAGIDVSTNYVRPVGEHAGERSWSGTGEKNMMETYGSLEDLVSSSTSSSRELDDIDTESYARGLLADTPPDPSRYLPMHRKGEPGWDRSKVINAVYSDAVKSIGHIASMNLVDPTRKELGLRSGQVGLPSPSAAEALAIHFGEDPNDEQTVNRIDSDLHRFAKNRAERIVEGIESSPYPPTKEGNKAWSDSVESSRPKPSFEETVKNNFFDMAGDAEASGEMDGMTKRQKRDYLVDEVYINQYLPEFGGDEEDDDKLNDIINEAISEYV